MSGDDHLRTAELNAGARDVDADRTADRGPASGDPDGFPLFGEQQQRQFGASPHPMRISEHATLRYLAVNDAALELYGYTREEFLKLTLRDTRHPEEHAEQTATFASHTGCLRHSGTRRHVRKSGEIIFVEVITQDVLFGERPARLSLTMNVTERKRTEQALRESNEFLRSVIESSRDCIKVLDLDGRLQWISIGGQRLMETDDATPLLNSSYLDFWSSTDREAACNALVAGRAGSTSRFEGYCPTCKGTPKWWDEIVTPILGKDGAPEKLLVVSRDITEHKRAEGELERQKQILDAIIENLPVGVFIRDVNTQAYVRRNRFAQERFGPKMDSYIGRTIHEVFPKELAEKFLNQDKELFQSGKMLELPDQWVMSPDGASRNQHVRKVPLYDEAGRPWLVVGIADDVTERKHAENRLRESEERFRLLAESIRQVFWINTPDGDHIDYISPAYEEIWGRSRESLYRNPRSWMELIHPDDLPAVRDGLVKMARGEATDVEYRIVRPDGTERWIRDCSYPMRRSDGKLLTCGIADDITDFKRADREQLTRAILQRDALVREVHHRIKNSLQGIVGLLRQKIRKNPAMASGIEEIIGQLQSVALVYGLQETRPDGLLSLAGMTDAICSSAESLIGGRVERVFEHKSPRPACVAGAEAVSVAVALNELVFNALKHQRTEAGKKRARVTLRESEDAAEIRISNRGCLPKGFDFAKGRSVGSGLELVRTLLASPGGSIAFNGGRNQVEVVLKLAPPLLAGRAANPVR